MNEDTFPCPKCGTENWTQAIICKQCFESLSGLSPSSKLAELKSDLATVQEKQWLPVQFEVRLDCQACKNEATMVKTKINKFSDVIRAIGVILVIPSILGLIWAWSIFYTGNVNNTMGIGFVAALIVAVPSFVSGLLGWLLLSTRKVFKCSYCGFILDRD